MIQQEISEKSQDVEKLENNLKILLLPKDVNDGKNVIVEIRGGAGGEEAALFAHSLLRMYTMYVQSRGWQLEMLNLNETELGGVKEAIFSVDGAGAYNRLKYESGVHRVQRVPETETQGRIHTSTATVAVMPQAEEVDFALDMKDLRIDTFRSSGAGGQHINKTSSAIRVTHLPTGMVVECQNERSQFQNKDKALEILRSRLPLILDGGECDVGVESTVVSVVGEKPTLFRPGHITLEDLERALGEEVEVSKAILEKLPEGAVVRSPGMKYKHYAPKADVTLLDGTFEQFKAYVDAHAEQNPSCLCFTGEAEKLGVLCVEYGREGDGADQAKHIFRCLRALDEQGDAVVYARCPQKDGLSMAVYNRLIRAAAFRVIKL